MWGIANAATKALTVDNSLDSATKLIGLAGDLNKVPASRITWATMQTQDVTVQGSSRTEIAPGAKAMFKSIATDQSLTAAAAGAGHSSSPTVPPVPIASIAVQVQNGTTVNGRALAIAQQLIDGGFSDRTAPGNGTPAATTSLTYPPGQKAQAQAVARSIGLPARGLVQGPGTRIVLLIGADWPTGATFPGGKAAPAPVDTQAALNGTNQQLGTDKKCAEVSTYKDVIGLDASGKPTSSDHPASGTSPTRAYALSPNVKDSAP
ncbi:LytR cell envelope-related transcriptional attenuator [Streptomyces sp. DvalAA-14]|nr:LytR cell envelope-related transcriptional attenuator [Streptomyces sp. DvalAA-14]